LSLTDDAASSRILFTITPRDVSVKIGDTPMRRSCSEEDRLREEGIAALAMKPHSGLPAEEDQDAFCVRDFAGQVRLRSVHWIASVIVPPAVTDGKGLRMRGGSIMLRVVKPPDSVVNGRHRLEPF
jgi:hypothetical protein